MGKYSIPQPGDKFLWVRFIGVGDVIEAVADVYQIKVKFPYIKIGFLTDTQNVALVSSQPYIDDVITGAKNSISIMRQTAKLIHQSKYHWIGSTFKGVHMAIMAYLSKIPNRLGCSKYLPFLDTANIYDWTREQGIDLLNRTEKSIFPSEENIAFAKRIMSPLEGKKKIFAIIGASRLDKMWPAEHWIEFLKPLVNKGWGVVLNGHGELEQQFADKIERALNSENVLNLANKLDLFQIMAAVSLCDITVGNDTGPMHFSTLQLVPSVIIVDYILPKEVGYNSPNVEFVIARNIKLEAGYAKKRRKEVYAEIKPQAVCEKFDELVKKCGIV